MSDYGKMQECWAVVRCTQKERVKADGETVEVRCPASARRNLYLGPVYHKHGTVKYYMEPMTLSAIDEGGCSGTAPGMVMQTPGELEEFEADVRGYEIRGDAGDVGDAGGEM